jgi:hypothetical protein
VPERPAYPAALLLVALLSSGIADGWQTNTEHRSVTELTAQQRMLQDQILAKHGPEARASAERLASSAGSVLFALAKHRDRNVRLLVLELAPVAPSADSSRAVISLLDDEEPTIHAVAMGDLAVCFQKEIAPDLVAVLKKGQNAELTAALIRQIGIAGDSANIGDIVAYRTDRDPTVAHQTSIALAKLGDGKERNQIIADLGAAEMNTRVGALRDSQYVADKSLAKYFGPALNDLRDFLVITPPHVEPRVVARVADVAVQTMAYMGFTFSFEAQFLTRFSESELQEAKRKATALPSAH